LFQQFFALEDSIEELKTQMQSEDFYDYYDSDDDLSSITSSACSIASVHEVVKPATADNDEEDDVFEAWTPKVGHVIQYKINLYTRLQKSSVCIVLASLRSRFAGLSHSGVCTHVARTRRETL
jgi:hypothetical protein